MSECPNCSKDIVQSDNRRPKVYCDDKCRGLHWRMTKSAAKKSIEVKKVKVEKGNPKKSIDYMIDLLS